MPVAAAADHATPAAAGEVGAAASASSGSAAAAAEITPEERLRFEHLYLDYAKMYRWDELKALLDETPDLLNVQPAGRWSALHQAAEEGNRIMVEDLLARRADINAVTRDGRTPLEVARGAAFSVMREAALPKKSVEIGPEIRVNVISQIAGDPLGEIICRTSDTMLAFGRSLRWQDPAGPNHMYTVFAGDQRLDPTQTFSEAGVEDSGTVGVVREKGTAVVVETLEDLWERRPGERYPIILSPELRGVLFYASEECLDEDRVEFSNIDFGGGFQRIFANQPGRPKEQNSGHHNFIQVFVLSTKELKVVEVYADEARFGGIVIQPASGEQ